MVLDAARGLNKRITHGTENDEPARLNILFEMLYARHPSAAESQRFLAFLDSFEKELLSTKAARAQVSRGVAWNRLCHTLLVSNEFIVIE
jgi:hypothetical protein